MRTLPALALALLLVTAGCNGLSGIETDSSTVAPDLRDTPTSTAEPTPTATPTSTPGSADSLPPGVTPSADDEVDERALYVAHSRALENRSVTWRDQRVRMNTTGVVLGWSTRTVWRNESQERYEVEIGGADPAAMRMNRTLPEYWTNSSATVFRLIQPDGSVETQVQAGGPPRTFGRVDAGRVVLESILTGSELQYIGVERRNGTEMHVLAETASDSRLTLHVDSDGVVHSLVYRTEGQLEGREITSVTRFRTYDIGTTVVEQPPWAANATEPDSGT